MLNLNLKLSKKLLAKLVKKKKQPTLLMILIENPRLLCYYWIQKTFSYPEVLLEILIIIRSFCIYPVILSKKRNRNIIRNEYKIII